ncbi:hypothetical protein GCM10018793_57440 [Streptomyces sulfonofaciens]|uniref:histidine kinase n=1 Tax=Streptomyces sulfonofaciens TaxID=68272 RepID=A0A919GKQ4_9ACTN|nr:ATP-binding protein [Streptomyces sulfonofaciens]GHH86243.1 hypothetical protein GCM10018793_57440 [Streptomyces sulfonofaciens]
MPHVPAPARPADRREGGGRHGRPGWRAGRPPLAIRARLLCLAVLPATAVALGGLLVALAAARATGSGGALRGVLIGAAAVTLAAPAVAAVAAHRVAAALTGRIVALRRVTARGQAELHELVESLRHGASPSAPAPSGTALPGRSIDELDRLAGELDRAHGAALAAVLRAARTARTAGGGPGTNGADGAPADRGTRALPGAVGGRAPVAADAAQLAHTVDVSVHLARRMQSLLHREISVLDTLEHDIEDPDLLGGLFQVDHLATRMRRHAENLAVLGGAAPRRRWSRPVPVVEVLRSAVAEVEQYPRVMLVPPTDGSVRGHAVADVAHLLAELVENATVFSAPGTPVLLRVAAVTAGLAIEVEDRGLGMPAPEQVRMNLLLSDPVRADATRLLRSGRTGLYVVSRLARRHGISVRLQSNIYGGIQAVLVLPCALLGTESPRAAGPRAVQDPLTAAPAAPAVTGGGTGTSGPGPRRGGAGQGGAGQADADRAAHTRTGVPAADDTAREHGAEASAPLHGAAPSQGPARGGSGTAARPRATSEAVSTSGVAATSGVPSASGAVSTFGVAATSGVASASGAAAARAAVSASGAAAAFAATCAAVSTSEAASASLSAPVPVSPSTPVSGSAPAPVSPSTPESGAVPASGSTRGSLPASVPAPAPAPACVYGAAPGHRPGPVPRSAGPVPGPEEGAQGPVGWQQGPVPPAPTAPPPAPARGPAVPASGPAGGGTTGESRPGHPRLPRRRAQEHLAPQLRSGPSDRSATVGGTGPNPELMAAFRRGIGLGTARREAGRPSGARSDGA